MRVAVLELSGLVGRRRHLSIGQQPVRGGKTSEVADLGQDHSGHTETQPRNSGNGRIKFFHQGLDLLLNFGNLSIQFTDETDGVLQFRGFGRHTRANGDSGGISDFKSHVSFVAAFRGGFEQCFQPRQMSCGDLFGAWELLAAGRKQRSYEVWEPPFPVRERGCRPIGK